MSVQPVTWAGKRARTARHTLRRYRRRAIAWRYGLREGIQAIETPEATVRYYVANYKEYWRAAESMSEPQLVEAIADACDPETVFWDVGSAVGTYACLAAVAGADVLAFEPVPENAHRITENAGLNGVDERVSVYPVALSSVSGTVPFRPSQRVVGEGTHRIDEAGATGHVPADVGASVKPAPDVLKIDVEGHECAVLDGMGSHLEAVQACFVEVHPDRGVSIADVRGELECAGMDVDRMDMDRDQPYLRGVRE